MSVPICVCVYVCVGFQESSFLIICARTAEDYDDDVDKRMTTSTGESPSSFSSCRLSLSLLTLCHSRLDQQADRRREVEEEEEGGEEEEEEEKYEGKEPTSYLFF